MAKSFTLISNHSSAANYTGKKLFQSPAKSLKQRVSPKRVSTGVVRKPDVPVRVSPPKVAPRISVVAPGRPGAIMVQPHRVGVAQPSHAAKPMMPRNPIVPMGYNPRVALAKKSPPKRMITPPKMAVPVRPGKKTDNTT